MYTPRRALRLAACLLGVLTTVSMARAASTTTYTYDEVGNLTGVTGCVPTTCAAQGNPSGSIPDGCGGTIWCACTPTTCAVQGKNCGSISNGCGGTLSCGTCSTGQTCSASNVCVAVPTLSLSTTTLSFNGTVGGANPAAQTVAASNSGSGTLATPTTSISYGSGSGWLSTNVGGSAAPFTIAVTPNMSGLSAGTYTATVSVSSTGAASSPQPVSVTLTVLAAPALSLSATSLTFSGTVGAASPAAKTVTATNSGGGTLAVPTTSVSYGSGSGWLTTSVSGSAAPYTIAVTPNLSGLSAGTYTATVSVVSAGASGSPGSVSVTLTVNSSGSSPPTLHSGFPVSANVDNITGTTVASPPFTPPANALLYAMVMGGGSARNVTGVTGGGLTWTRAVQRATADGVAAIFTAVMGSNPTAMTATATLDVGDTRSIVVYAFDNAQTTAGATASADATWSGTLAVSITPQASNSLLLCAASNCAGDTAFTMRSGSVADYNQPLSEWGNAHMTCRSTGTVTAGQAYTIGSTAPTGADGNIVAIEVLAGSGGTPSAPALSLSTSALSFSGTVGGVSPTAQTVTASNSGSGTLAMPTTSISYGSGSGWLSTSVSGSAAPYTIAVTPSLSGLSAGIYTATVNVVSAGASGSPASVSVSLTIGTSGSSTISEDSGFPVTRQIDWSSTVTTFAVSTAGANRLLVVSVNCDWSDGAGLTVSGAGLTWTRPAYRTNGSAATSQIWVAWAASQLSNATITVTPPVTADYFITVDALSGARNPTGLVAGTDFAVADAVGSTSPAVTIPSVTTKGASGSWLLGSASITGGGAPRTYDSNNTQTSAWIRTGDTAMWTQRRNGALAAGTYSIGTTGPSTTDDWSMVALEILAGSGGGGGSPPPVPTNPRATAQSPSSIQFSWDTSTGATSYKVESAPDLVGIPGSWSLIASGVNQNSFTDTGLSANTTYWFRARATNTYGDSDPSTAVSATTQFNPALSLSTTSLTFSGATGGSNPAAQTVIVTNGGGGTLATPTTSISYGSGSGWLSTSVSGSAAPYTITVTPNMSGLSAGTYTATVNVASAGAASSPRSVSITLTVQATPTLSVSTTSLTFSAIVGGPASPTSQTVTASNTGGGTLATPTTSISYSSGSGWLSAAVSGTAAPYTITITPNVAALGKGTFTATANISSAGATGSPRSVSVSLTVGCSNGWDNCDGNPGNGCETNLLISTSNCGSCGHGCNGTTNGSATCNSGTCGVTCNSGYTPCGNQCLVLTSDPNNCGACGNKCSANAVCCNGSCKTPATDVNNCGSCSNQCTSAPANATPTCNNGSCGFNCNSGYTNCSGTCRALATDINNCGTCGRVCSNSHASSASCSGGSCQLTCATECVSGGDLGPICTTYANCNGNPSDGCETPLYTDSNCASCGNACTSGYICGAQCDASGDNCYRTCVSSSSGGQ